jgi:DNA polymerase III sliding clamp (beta) subunit (PCNA family)
VKSYQGENVEVQIGFNAYFLNMCLAEITSHDVVININSSNKAATLTDANRPDKTLLIMPVMING